MSGLRPGPAGPDSENPSDASDILCVTNRLLCREPFLKQIEKIAACHPAGIILREKDLSEAQYEQLASSVMEICRKNRVPCILHSFVHAATVLEAEAIHLPLPILRSMTKAEKSRFRTIGASCHSPEEAKEAEQLGCTYLTAGHIFLTDCKRGVPARGTEFLQRVCECVAVPVYGIGGISPQNISEVRRAGARGACIMSGLMQCEDVAGYLEVFCGAHTLCAETGAGERI